MIPQQAVKSVMFVNHCYYNHWYVSRELRKLGWKADVVSTDSAAQNQMYYHGTDVFIYRDTDLPRRINYFIGCLNTYQIFHFANTEGITLIHDFDIVERKQDNSFKTRLHAGILSYIDKRIIRNKLPNLFRLYNLIIKLIGVKGFTRVLKHFMPYLPLRWDILLLKRMGKKIVYTNNGCRDGVSKTSFSKWKTAIDESVCDICRYYADSVICSDEKNLKWGAFRNAVADYQCLLGGNRIDFNDAPSVHEVPEIYALDSNFWRPNIFVPTNYKLPLSEKTVKLYHAVGNYEVRTHGDNRTIKSTHIYVPLVEKLQSQGYDVELIFFTDLPNKIVRYYQAQADVFVDMLTYGFFGANLREGMMLGKPCVCYLRPEWMEEMRREIPEYADELPIINANPDTIEEILKDLILNPAKRKEIGRKSREFAVKWHSSEAGGKRMDEIYSSLLKKHS